MQTIKIKQVDAFTRTPFGGNPAGVVTDANGLDTVVMQKIAREINASETAFVSKSDVADFQVRFFTPNAEVDLCGHATIATFATLFEEGRLDPSRSTFTQETKAGVLPVEIMKNETETLVMMTQATPRFVSVPVQQNDIAAALGLVEADLLSADPLKVYTGLWWFVVGIRSLEQLMQVRPNFNAIEAMCRQHEMVGFIPFCIGTVDPDCTYHMRAFAPAVGVEEDPVCGTGNGCAASYIARNGLIDFASEAHWVGEAGWEVDRPGRVSVIVEKVGQSIEKIKVGGTAYTILAGEMKF